MTPERKEEIQRTVEHYERNKPTNWFGIHAIERERELLDALNDIDHELGHAIAEKESAIAVGEIFLTKYKLAKKVIDDLRIDELEGFYYPAARHSLKEYDKEK